MSIRDMHMNARALIDRLESDSILFSELKREVKDLEAKSLSLEKELDSARESLTSKAIEIVEIKEEILRKLQGGSL